MHALCDLDGKALDECVERHAAFRIVTTAGVHADGAVLHVVVADDEHVGHLLELGAPDARAERVGVRVDHLGAEVGVAELLDDLLRVLVVPVGDRAAP